jgi:beta-glucosidase
MLDINDTTIPKDFLWGVASASYQIEGFPLTNGASPSIWHNFSHKRGKIHNNENADLACDHYHRYSEDIGHMKEIGIGAYRFSIAWPRIFPEPGKLNPRGLDFYRRLVDGLLDAGITPFITVFHWDAPQWFEDLGGFLQRKNLEHFVQYGRSLFETLGDRVNHWITLNEPVFFSLCGYLLGNWPPGKRNQFRQMFTAAHHQLLAHGRLIQEFRDAVPSGTIGIAEGQLWVTPLRPENKRDRETAELMDCFLNRFYIDPIILGRYPKLIVEKLGRFLPTAYEQDLKIISTPLDFVGINYYLRQGVRYAPFIPYLHAKAVHTPNLPRSAMWEYDPEGLFQLLMRLKTDYGNPTCYITENGFPLTECEGQSEADFLNDQERIDYLREHVKTALRVKVEGVNLKGYFHWSLMDNFEWDHGYAMRFGLIRVDFKNLKRSWRKSAYWYKDLIRHGVLPGG